MTSISLKMVEVVILGENSYHFVSYNQPPCVKWDNYDIRPIQTFFDLFSSLSMPTRKTDKKVQNNSWI